MSSLLSGGVPKARFAGVWGLAAKPPSIPFCLLSVVQAIVLQKMWVTEYHLPQKKYVSGTEKAWATHTERNDAAGNGECEGCSVVFWEISPEGFSSLNSYSSQGNILSWIGFVHFTSKVFPDDSATCWMFGTTCYANIHCKEYHS